MGISAGGCGVKCFIIQNVAQLLFNSGCGEFQIMCTEQHGLFSIYTASILAVQRFQTAVLNGYSHT